MRKYIEAKYPPPIKLTSKNLIGSIIYSILDKQGVYRPMTSQVQHLRYALLTDEIKVLMPRNHHTIYTIGFHVQEAKAIFINDMFEKMIREEMYAMCKWYKHMGLPQRQAIEDFCEEYNIILEIDITYDAMKQAEFRYRESRKKNPDNLIPKLSPALCA